MVERRLTWLALIILLWGGAIFYKLISLQVMHHLQYVRMARARQELVVEIPAPRGTIFDRSGRVLAMSAPTESVYVNPQKVDVRGGDRAAGRVAPSGSGGTLRRDPARPTKPSRLPVDQAPHLRRGVGPAAPPRPGMDRLPAREPAPLSQRQPGGARARLGGFRGEGQRRASRSRSTRTFAAQPGADAAADRRQTARHRFPPGYRGAARHFRSPSLSTSGFSSSPSASWPRRGAGAPCHQRQRGGDESATRAKSWRSPAILPTTRTSLPEAGRTCRPP